MADWKIARCMGDGGDNNVDENDPNTNDNLNNDDRVAGNIDDHADDNGDNHVDDNNDIQGAEGGLPSPVEDRNNADVDIHEPVVFTDMTSLLRDIQDEFLDNVDPIENGFVDKLRSVEALSSEDEQAISGASTRREKARKFWMMLRRIPEEDFAASFMPAFKKEFPYIMRRRQYCIQDGLPISEKCMFHAMRERIKFSRLLDIVHSVQCCSLDDYSRLQEVSYCGDREWCEMLGWLHKHASNQQLCEKVHGLLRRKKIANVECFSQEAANGFSCTCKSKSNSEQPHASQQEDLLSKLSRWSLPATFSQHVLKFQQCKEASSGAYPFSSRSSKMSLSELTTDSGVAEDELDDQPFCFADLNQFQTTNEKRDYEDVKDKINTAITHASTIRVNFRCIERLRDKIRVVGKPAGDEPEPHLVEMKEELRKMLAQAQEYKRVIEQLCHNVLQAWRSVQDLDNCLSFPIPPDWNKLMRERHHLLHNEMRECQHFADRAKAAVDEAQQFCLLASGDQPVAQPERNNDTAEMSEDESDDEGNGNNTDGYDLSGRYESH